MPMSHVRDRERGTHGSASHHGRILGVSASAVPASEAEALSVSWAQTRGTPRRAGGDPLRAQNRDSLGGSARRDGLLRHDVLEAIAPVEPVRTLGQDPPGSLGQAQRSGPVGLGAGGGGLQFDPRCGAGKKTGPSPTDRRKYGSKHHVLSEGHGLPMAAVVTGANTHDVTQIIALVDAVPSVRGKVGHPRRRPVRLYADRAYDSKAHRQALRSRGITPYIAKRGTDHGSGLGKFRWVIERTNAWLHQLRRLRCRFERRDDIHEAFLKIGCALICWRALQGSFC